MLSALVLAVATVLLIITVMTSQPALLLVPAQERRSMPDFEIFDVQGRSVKLSDYSGKVVLLNFWATWCQPCERERPRLVDLQSKFGGRGFAVLAVSMDSDGRPVVDQFLKSHDVNYRVGLGYGSVQLTRKLGNISALPTTFVVDRHRRIAAKILGPLDSRALFARDEIEALLNKLLHE
jgi:peroxiredoxin